MNVFLSADIEGTCGIVDWAETERSTPYDYTPFRKQMTREVGAACEGALAAGADSILVRDAHDSARNIDAAILPEAVQMLRGWTGDPLHMMSGIDREDFACALFTGYHSWAGGDGNPLSHTNNTRNEFVTLNGMRMSEFLANAYTAAYFGVPVCFLSGDKALCEFAKTLIPDITTVAVSEGIGGASLSLHPERAIRAIRDGAKRAVKRAKSCTLVLPERFDAVIRFREHANAYSKSFYPGATLTDGKNVCFSTDDWFEMLRFFHFTLSA